MQNPIKAIYQWQKEAGNLDHPYDDFLESSFQIEEALEGLKDLPYLATRLHSEQLSFEENFNPKECSRQIVRLAMMDDKTPLSDVDRFDKAIDAIIFAIGSLGKLGLTPQQIQSGLLAVNHANMQKLGMPRDEHGKLIKPKDFVGPEPELQKILNERRSDDKS